MAERTFLTRADLVLPDRVLSRHTLVVEDGCIGDIVPGAVSGTERDRVIDLSGRIIAPGFVDVHVHGVEGHDALDGPDAIAAIAARLPRSGVTAFCPTSVACAPGVLDVMLAAVAQSRVAPAPGAARVLGAHLESNFINPAFCGAQPVGHLRAPRGDADPTLPYSAADVLAAIDRRRPDVAVVTLAPELEGGLNLVQSLAAAGIRVSIGHSGATFEQVQAAIAAGARRVTHLFNRMSPMTHRYPGVVGAALAAGDVAVELIADGHHVHPAAMRVAVAAKGPGLVMAISDGTAGSGLPRGTHARLGGRDIVVDDVARLEDGTTAGSVATMDRVFATLVSTVGLDLVEAAAVCATTPVRQLGLAGHGALVRETAADLVVLDRDLRVCETWIEGARVFVRA